MTPNITINLNVSTAEAAAVFLDKLLGIHGEHRIAEAPAPKTTEAVPVTPPATAPVTPQYTLEQLQRAAVQLVDAGKTDELFTILHECGAQSAMDLKPENYTVFADKLRTAGVRV